MSDPRHLYLDAAAVALQLIGSREVEAGWDQPSALEAYDVGALAAHLGRAVLTLEIYLAAPEPDASADVLDTAAYYARVLGDHDPVDSDLHRGVRRRSAAAAAGGHAALVADLERSLSLQRDLDLPADRLIAVLDGVVLRLCDYCVTRLVELLVHGDDLARSVGLGTPAYADEAWDLVGMALHRVAADRHGARAVALSLARPERGSAGAFG